MAVLHAPGELFEELAEAHRERWTHTDELLALVLEKLDELTIVTETVWTDPKSRPPRAPRPFRYQRPFVPEPPKPATLDEIRRFFER